MGCAGTSVIRRQLTYRVGDPVHALADELEGIAGELAACSLALLVLSPEHHGQDGAGWLVLLTTDLGKDLATAAAVRAATQRPGPWRELHPETPQQEHDEGFVAARELARVLMPAVRAALGAVRVATEPGFVRYPRGTDIFEARSGTHESVAALDRLVDDLLERLLDDDLGFEYLATHRDESGRVIVEGDRLGMLRLAREALRLAAGRGAATASFDAGSYLQNIEDIVIFKCVPTPPRGGTRTKRTEGLWRTQHEACASGAIATREREQRRRCDCRQPLLAGRSRVMGVATGSPRMAEVTRPRRRDKKRPVLSERCRSLTFLCRASSIGTASTMSLPPNLASRRSMAGI